MTGKMDTKPRRVRCPRCLSLLSEPSDVLLYECGGCGAKLQAKKRNNINITVDNTSQRLDDDSSGKQKVDQVFGDQEAGSSSNQQSLLTDESDQNSDHNDLHSSNKDQAAAKRAENGTVDAPQGVVEDYLFEKLKMKQLPDDQDPNQQLLVNSSVEPDPNIHNDPRSSTEFSGHEDPQSSPEATAHNRTDQEHKQKHDQSYCQEENMTAVELEDSSGKQTIKQLSDDQDPNQQLLVNSSVEPDQNIHNDPRSSTEFSGHEDPQSSPEATAHNRTDQEQKQKHDQSYYQYACKQQENMTVVGLEDSSGKQTIKQLSDDDDTGSGLTHLLSVNSMNNLYRNNDDNDHRSSSELSYHDNQESSSPEATVHNKVIKGNETGNEESSSEFEDIAATRIISDSDGGSKSSFRTMIAKKLPDTRQKKPVYLDEDDLLSEDGSVDLHRRRRFGGAGYYGYDGSVSSFDGNDDQNPSENQFRSIGDKHVDSGNRHRFNRRNEHRSTDIRSFYDLNEFHENPRHRSPMISENLKLERLELLKLVRELQDQLERTNVSNLQKDPSYYNHVLSNPGRYDRRMAFSGEATEVNRRRERGSCHHCCPQPQDRHFSAQLPSHRVCCNGPDFRANTYHSPRFSGPSSPKPNCSESDFSLTDDQWQSNRVTKPFHSPKKKRYVRPIAGGSPWIVCYLCSKLLQLPQSFLLFNKRYHTLRCGGCLKVLSFTVLNGTHVSRYYPKDTIVTHPSSEVEDFGKGSGSWTGPVSCSDRSFEKSYSTETDRKGSREFSEDRRKIVVSRDLSGSTRPSSSKISRSEIEVSPGHNGSPLHWLMGYASPSKVIRG